MQGAAGMTMNSKHASQVTSGLVVVLVGLVLLAGQMGTGLNFSRLWPFILIVLGTGRFLSVYKNGRRCNGGFLLFLGGLFLLHTFQIWSLRSSWPLFIVAAGVSMMFNRPPVPPMSSAPVSTPPPEGTDRFQNGRFQP
jgi:hypothetical protein